MLYGLFAVAIPVIIHLLNRRRHRTIKWAAMQFLLKASQESRGKKRLKHILILTCRALAIAALIFAIARPLVGGLLGWGGGSVDSVMLILDRSASMELRSSEGGQSLREGVINRVSDAVKEIQADRLILIDSATGEPQEVPSIESLPLLSTTAATQTQADIPGLISGAVDYLRNSPAGNSEIWVASDLQEGDWKPEDPRWESIRSGLANLSPTPKLRILTADSKTQNYALELLSSRRVGDELVLELQLLRREDQGPASVPVTISLNGARSAEKVTINGQELTFQKRLPLPAGDQPGQGWVGLPADNNPQDNEVFFAYGPGTAAQTYLVTEAPGEASASLERAAAPPGFGKQEVTTLQPAESHRIDFSAASLIIWMAPLPTGPVASELRQFLTAGGTVSFFPPESASPESFLGISWGAVETSPQDKYFVTGASTRDDGPWADGSDGTPLPVDVLQAIKRRAIEGEGGVLAAWDDGTPLLLRKVEGEGTAVFFGTLPDYRWSSLEQTALHLVAVQRLLAAGNERLHAEHRAFAGEDKARPKDGEIRERVDSAGDLDSANGDYQAGVFRLGDRLLAVNRPPGEASPVRIDRDTLDNLLAGTDFSLFEEKTEDKSLVQEAWRAFLIAMILFLIAEAILCLQKPKSERSPAARARARAVAAKPV